MEFLVLGKGKEVMLTLPPSVLLNLLEAAIPHMDEQGKGGKFREFHYMPGWNRFMNISVADSAEELSKNMMKNPALGLLDIEIYPLTDGAEAWKDMTKALKSAQQTAA